MSPRASRQPNKAKMLNDFCCAWRRGETRQQSRARKHMEQTDMADYCNLKIGRQSAQSVRGDFTYMTSPRTVGNAPRWDVRGPEANHPVHRWTLNSGAAMSRSLRRSAERPLRLTLLGTGSSAAVPNIACVTKPQTGCEACLKTLHPGGEANIRGNTGAVLRIPQPDGTEKSV